MERIRAFVPLDFFHCYMYDRQILNSNALAIRAIACGPEGTTLRSQEYLLFGNGLATLMFEQPNGWRRGYIMDFTKRVNKNGTIYWEIQSVPEQIPIASKLQVTEEKPDSEFAQILVGRDGDPGQYFFIN